MTMQIEPGEATGLGLMEWLRAAGALQTDVLQFFEDGAGALQCAEPSFEAAMVRRDHLRARFQSAIQLGLVRVDALYDDKLEEHAVRIGPGGACGFCSVWDKEQRCLFVEAGPKKLGSVNADVLGLMCRAGRLPSGFRKAALGSSSRNDPILLLLAAAYRTALEDLLLKHGLRRLHEPRSRTLRGRIRGQVQVPRYLQHFAAGRPLEFPCRFGVHDLDNTPNQVLMWALELLTRAGWGHPHREVRRQVAALGRLSQLMPGISCTSVSPAGSRAVTRLPASFDAYGDSGSGALPLAMWVIENLDLGQVAGPRMGQGFSYVAHQVFEAALAEAVAEALGVPATAIAQQKWTFRAGEGAASRGGLYKPDLYLPATSNHWALVADTKWKAALGRGVRSVSDETVLDVRGVEIKNTDLNQILAYSHVARALQETSANEVVVGVLVYPVTGTSSVDLEPIRVDLTGARDPLQLWLLPWEVGVGALEEGTAEVVRTLDRLRQRAR